MPTTASRARGKFARNAAGTSIGRPASSRHGSTLHPAARSTPLASLPTARPPWPGAGGAKAGAASAAFASEQKPRARTVVSERRSERAMGHASLPKPPAPRQRDGSDRRLGSVLVRDAQKISGSRVCKKLHYLVRARQVTTGGKWTSRFLSTRSFGKRRC